MIDTQGDWVRYDLLRHGYVTGDGTFVAAEIVDRQQCFADVLHVARIRSDQRAKMIIDAEIQRNRGAA